MSPSHTKTRRLGTQGLQTFAIGPGCMVMSEFYGSSNGPSLVHPALNRQRLDGVYVMSARP
jgi:hypothetical protein